jgi:hypothetical protein
MTSTLQQYARASRAIDAYAAEHGLSVADMPSRGRLIAVLTTGMARHGAKFTEADVRFVIDEAVRCHVRQLDAAAGGRR